MAVKYLQPYKRPTDYGGATFPSYYTVYAITRDASTLERSNWRVLLRTCGFTAEGQPTGYMRTNAPNADEDDPNNSDPIIVTRAGHWAVGWIETLRIRQDADATVIATLDEMIGRLENYPVLDEDDWSGLEDDEASEYWAGMSTKERVYYLTQSGLSIFAARRKERPDDPNGRLHELLTRA